MFLRVAQHEVNYAFVANFDRFYAAVPESCATHEPPKAFGVSISGGIYVFDDILWRTDDR